MKKITASVLSVAIALAGCATASKDVATSYVSPIQFSNYTCDQITAESARLQVRLSQLEGRLDTASANDKALTGVAILLFWPAVFALGGTKEQEAEYGRLKGEHDALRQVWIQKNCTITAATLLPGTLAQNATAFAAAAPIQAAPQANGSGSFLVGDRLTYRVREPVSGADQGESKVVISSIANGQIGLDDDSLIMGTQGTLIKGNVVRPTILGLDVSRLQPGNRFQGKYRIVAARVQDVPVDLTVNGVEILELSGRRINAVRIDVSGYAGRDTIPGVLPVGLGAPFSGTLLVDPATGIVISMKIKSQNPMYSYDWALVGIANSAASPVTVPSAPASMPIGAVPMPGPSLATGTTPLVAGDHLTYRTRDTVSGLDQGETKMVISSFSDGVVGFDEGSLVMSTQGVITKGKVTSNAILGVDVSRLYPGNQIHGNYRVVSANSFDNPIVLRVVGPEIFEVSGRRLNAVRLDVSGYVKGGGGYNAGAPISGVVLVEATTGIVISMKMKSSVFALATDRMLVAVTNPVGNPAVKPSASAATAAPSQSPTSTQAQSKEEKLRELKRLYDAGLINAEVYSAQQKAILGN